MAPRLPIRDKEHKSELTKFSLTESRQASKQTCHLKYAAARGCKGGESQRSKTEPDHLQLNLATGINLSPESFCRYKLQLSLSNLARILGYQQRQTSFLSYLFAFLIANK